MKSISITLLFAFLLALNNSFGQNNCGAAVPITLGTQYCGTNSYNGSFPNAGGAPTNPCNSFYNDGEYWFSVTGTGTALELSLTNISDTYAGLFVLDACPGTGSCVASITNGFSTGNMYLTTPALTSGQTYYIVVANWSSPFQTNFCFEANAAAPPPGAPANDDPCGATPLTVGASCSFATYTTTAATNSSLTTTVTLPTCANFQGGDVWFSFTAPASGHVIIDTDTGVITDAGMALYSGPDCNTLLEVDCDDDGSANGLMSFIEQTTLTPGATYWIRVWEYGNDNPGTFDICIYDGGGVSTGPCSGGAGGSNCATMNPFCTSNTYCFTAQTGTTAEAGNNYGCLITQPNPTWYYFEISTSGNLVFDMSAGSDIDFALWGPFPSLAAAQANCGSLGAPIDCSYSTSPTETGNVPSAVAGQVYVLLVTNYAGVVQDITINTGAGNSATTNCSIVNCGADAGSW